jgi:hypothetical protein
MAATRTATRTWQRRIIATGVVAGAVITPLWSATPASAASLCAPPADTVAPQVTGLTLSKATVDLNSGSRKITVTADAIDTSGNGTPSGVKQVYVEFHGPRYWTDTNLSLTSGTPVDGVWTGTLTVPKGGPAGTWTLRSVSAVDADRNYQNYTNGTTHADSPTDVRFQSGWDTSFTVTGTGPPPPTKVPAGKLTGFRFTPQAVNTTNHAKKVHISATFSDPAPTHVEVFFQRVSGRGIEVNSRLKFTSKGGGKWVGHVTVHRWLGDSKAQAQMFASYGPNVTPRFRSFDAAKLEARHFPSQLAITSGVDKTKPVLNTLTFTPSSVNTVPGPQTITVTATASDALSGVKHVNVDMSINGGAGGSAAGFYPFPGLGYYQNSDVYVSLKRSGDTWTGTAKFRRCVPSGNWKVSASVQDRAGNSIYYTSKKLTAASLPGTIAVTATPGDVDPPDVRNATAAGVTNTITLDFTEGVKNVNTSTLSVYAMKPKATRFEATTPINSIQCSNGMAYIDCSGSGGLVTSAILQLTGPIDGLKYQVYANLNQITTQLTDGAGNPLSWNYAVAQVTGS